MKKRSSLLALSLALALPLAAVPAALRAAADPLDGRINIELRNAAPAEVFKSFGQLTGMEVTIDPAIQRKLSIRLENVRVRTALDAACESLDCRWEPRDGRLVFTAVPGGGERKPPAKADAREVIDIRVTNADVQDLIKTFGELVGAEVVLDPAVTGKVSLDLRNTPWSQGLDTVCKQAGCAWSLSGGEKGEKKVLKVSKR